MEARTLYVKGGKYTLEPQTGEYFTMLRLVAAEGKRLTQDGENLYAVIDVYSADGWYEVDYEEPTDEVEELEDLLLDEMGV